MFNYSNLIPDVPKSSFSREFLVAFGQIIFQIIFLLKLDKRTIINYVGNLMTVSFLGSIMLMPMLVLNQLINLPIKLVLVWFGITVLIMFKEHLRRIKILNLPFYLCFTWGLYRIIALLLILNL